MAKCSSCSAPLPAGSIKCEYCGCRNDVDLTAIHYYTTHQPDQFRNCPRCSIPLKTVDLGIAGTFLIERCDQCLGLFFDPGELEALLEASVTNVYAVDRSRLQAINASRSPETAISYVKCPVCSRIMNRINYGTRSGVVVDRCKDHGIWLDGGELRHLSEWMKAGGKLLHQERQEQLKKEEAVARERENNKEAFLRRENGAQLSDNFGGTVLHGEPDLFHILAKIVRIFT